jgi:hypothetical protein
MTPPECEIAKELDYNICMQCKKKCSLGQALIMVWEKYRNDKWYENMRREIADVMEAR